MKKRYYFASFFSPIILFHFIVFFMDKYPYSEKMLTSGDFMGQYLPLYAALKSAILSLDWSAFYWSFQKGMGGTMPSVFGFNSLSPLTVLYTFFEVKDYAMVTLVVTTLRYALTSLSMFYYLDRTKKVHDSHTPLLSLLFALAYSFSGYAVKNHINPNFLDNLMYFPLLLIGFEQIMAGHRSLKYPLMMGLMWITNFYTAFMATLFIVFYGFMRTILLDESLKGRIKRYVSLGLHSLAGIFLVAFWLLPIFLSLLDSKASAMEIFSVDFTVLYHPIHLISKFFVGSFHSTDHNALPSFYFSLLGFIGLVHFFMSDRISRREKWIHGLFIIFMLLTFNLHFFDQVWHMGQRPYGFYFRNAWVFSFYLMTLSYQALNQEWRLKSRELSVQLLLITTMFVIVLSNDYKHLILEMKALTFIIYVILLLIFIFKEDLQKFKIVRILFFLSFIELTVNTSVAFNHFYWYDSVNYIENYHSLSQTPVFRQLEAENPHEFYRADFYKTVILSNLSFYNSNRGLSHFSSSLEFSQIQLYEKLGLPSSTSMLTYQPNPLTDTLFHLKYYGTDKLMAPYLNQIKARYQEIGPFYDGKELLENNHYLDFGILVNEDFVQPILEDDNPFIVHNDIFKKLFNHQEELYQKVEFSAIIPENLTPSDSKWQRLDEQLPIRLTYKLHSVDQKKLYFIRMPEEEYDLKVGKSQLKVNQQPYYFLDRYGADQIWPIDSDTQGQITLEISSEKLSTFDFSQLELYTFDLEMFSQLIAEKKVTDPSLHFAQPTSFTGTVTVNDETTPYLFLSIPYNKGWQARVDGKIVEIKKVWDTLMAVEFPVGSHQFELTYYPPGLKLGLGVSIFTLLMMVDIALKKLKTQKLKYPNENLPG